MCNRLVVVVAASLLLAAAPARAQTVDAQSLTLLSGHADPRDGRTYTVVPAYESVSLLASDLPIPHVYDAQLVMRAWGEMAFQEPRPTVNADVDVLYLAGKFYKRHFELRIGRQLVIGGAARITQLDGASLTARGPWGLGATVYGGVPVTPRFGMHRGDAAVGGRLFWRHSIATELGLSIIDVLDRGVASRFDLGFDGRVAPNPAVVIDAMAIYSLAEFRVAEAQLAATWTPLRQLDFSVDAHHTAPDLFLPRTSIFAVFSNETHDEYGARAYARPIRWLRLYGDWHYITSSAGEGQRAGVKATLSPTPDATIGLEERVLTQSWTGGYVQSRLFWMHHLLPALLLTVDGDLYWLDRDLNGQRWSFTAASTLSYDFSPSWRLTLTGLVDHTPLVAWSVEGMAKLVYNWSWRSTRTVR